MRMVGKTGPLSAVILTAAICLSYGYGRRPSHRLSEKPAPEQTSAQTLAGRLSALEEEFARTWWSILKSTGCLTCHGKSNPSTLVLPQNPREAFRYLLEHDYFSLQNAGSLLSRVRLTDGSKRMPPDPFPAWSPDLIDRLKSFSQSVVEECDRLGIKPDEVFPFSLTLPYQGPTSPGGDNTILTYYQLRKKIKTLFGMDWTRGGKDLFDEHISLFGGADFRRYFSEMNRPTANYLAGLDMMARDISSQAFVTRKGPFRDFPTDLPNPSGLRRITDEYRRALSLLYQRLLFRNPTEKELGSSFEFLRQVAQEAQGRVPAEYTLGFEVTAQDEEQRTASERITLTVLSRPKALYQGWIDQTRGEPGKEDRQPLSPEFHFKPGEPEQWVRISNEGTYGVVSVSAVQLIGPLPEDEEIIIKSTDRSVLVTGAWRRVGDGYHDNDEHKGGSEILFPINVKKEGRYKVSIVYHALQGRRMARAVPVVIASLGPDGFQLPPINQVAEKGEARFFIDQTNDTIPFWDSKVAFRFSDSSQGVEIRNEGTIRQVVADAVRFVPMDGGPPILVRSTEAEGQEAWENFDAGAFAAYNTIGPRLLSDGNKRKGQLRLIYRPSVSPLWRPEKFYRLEITYPAKEGNETQTPVIVRADASTPVLQIRSPLWVRMGAKATMDATTTYNTQRGNLRFNWRQIEGPRAQLNATHSGTLTFEVPSPDPTQVAWESLCRLLISHPDFIFTRPPSLSWLTDPRERRKLLLVKIGQDLAGRPPTEKELSALDSGATLRQMVDYYLQTDDFKAFYFHRVRLFLESHGTPEDDEPVRLWCYIAFKDRPFSEILTADYTVDEKMRPASRPSYHGRTGILTMKGFIKGKPGLPHFNYAAVVLEKFLGYVFEVPADIVNIRQTVTAAATTEPGSVCYTCHKILTPLAYQRLRWTDDGQFKDDPNIDDSDRGVVASYPFKGRGMEAFATQAVKKERFVRTMIDTHFLFFFGRNLRWQTDERDLYRRLYDSVQKNGMTVRGLIRSIVLSPEYLGGSSTKQTEQPRLFAQSSAQRWGVK